MKTLIAVTAAMAATAMTTSAFAAPPTGYANLGYTQMDGTAGDVGSVEGRLGLRFGRYLGVEGELSQGVRSDDINVGGVSGEVKARPAAAAYAVGFLPLSDRFDILARVGYGTTRERVSLGNTSTSMMDHNINYGVGAQYVFDGSNGVRADYIRKTFTGSNSTWDDANAYSVSYVHRF